MAPIRRAAETLRMVQRVHERGGGVLNDDLMLAVERCACHLERHELVDSDQPGAQKHLATQIDQLERAFSSHKLEMMQVIGACAAQDFVFASTAFISP